MEQRRRMDHEGMPRRDFVDPGPHTITYSGSKHFDQTFLGAEETLDYTWSVSVTFKRV